MNTTFERIGEPKVALMKPVPVKRGTLRFLANLKSGDRMTEPR